MTMCRVRGSINTPVGSLGLSSSLHEKKNRSSIKKYLCPLWKKDICAQRATGPHPPKPPFMKLRIRNKRPRSPTESSQPLSQPLPLQKKVSFSMEVESRSFQQKVFFKTTTSATSNVPSMFVLAENNARARSSSTLTTVNYPRASPPADAFPLHAHRSKMHRSQYNSEDDSSSSSSDSGSSSSSSSDGSSSDDYSDSDGCEDEQDEFPVRQNGKQTAMEMERAARLLLSVSPALVARPRSMSVSHLEPLESLAGLGKLLSGSFSFFFFCGAIAPHTSVSNSSCFDSCSTASLDDGHSMSGDSNGAGSINKLHACLSGLTRGSRANYGSLASFQHDQTSLYSAMAPQSFLLSNLTRQRERTKNIKKLNKKKKKLLKKKRKAEAKAMRKRMRRNKRHQRDGGGSSSSYEPNHKKSKTTIIALPKDMRKKKSKKKKKSGKTVKKKIKVVDAAGKAALASAKLVNAPVNPECPDYLKAKYGEFFVLDEASGWYRLEGCGRGGGSHHSWNFCYFFICFVFVFRDRQVKFTIILAALVFIPHNNVWSS